jgi:predicted ATPase
MNKINRIRIHGFRRLEDLDLAVKPFMAILGANGAGKSSLLNAFSLLSASASGRLNETLSQLGGVSSLLTRDRCKELSLLVEMEVPGYRPLEYEFHLGSKGTGYAISTEILSQRREGYNQPFKHIHSSNDDIRYYEIGEGRLIRPEWEHNPLETSLSQVPKMFREPEELRRILANAIEYHALDVGPRSAVKLPQQMKPAMTPGTSGEDLVSYLYYLRESEQDCFSSVIDSLQVAFPDFESLNFPPVAAGMLALTWKDRKFNKPFYMHELSEGTLRFLWLVALLQSPALPTITMIDEPEVSLHPEMLSLLADLMREASKRTQLIVATHSDRFVRFLRPDEIVVMDVNEQGATKAIWADSFNLDVWLAEYSLDAVWAMGRMGGRT